MESLLNILQKTTGYFEKHGIENPKLDAEHLIAHVLDCSRMQLYLQFERPMDESLLGRLRPLVKRRASREPLQYILGRAAFMDFELEVDSRVLIPRPETEELVERIQLDLGQPSIGRILDLGTGSGAIACALAHHFSGAQVVATDISTESLDLATTNVKRLGLEERIKLVKSDWFDQVEGNYDLIVSNPPYLSDRELESVEPELARYEPRRALTAGHEGLEAIETLVRQSPEFLNPSGRLYMEIGEQQGPAVRELIRNSSFEGEVLTDLNRKARFVRLLLKSS